jgi:hypothetical protein
MYKQVKSDPSKYWYKNVIKNRIKYNSSTNITKNRIKISYICYVKYNLLDYFLYIICKQNLVEAALSSSILGVAAHLVYYFENKHPILFFIGDYCCHQFIYNFS